MDKTASLPNYEPISLPISFSRKSSTGNASYAYHRHNVCEVFLFLSGRIHFYIEQSCFFPVPGTLVILNPDEMHRVQSLDDSPYERVIIYLSQSYIRELSHPEVSLGDCFFARPSGPQNLRVLSPEALEEFFTLYRGLEESILPERFGGIVAQRAYASLLLLFLDRQFRIRPSSCKNTMPSYITGSMQYMENHLTEPLRLSVLAGQFHISESYLSTQFKHHTGLTLRAYLLDRKINRAKLLLQQGASVTEACYGSGFNDYANFIRSFKKFTGISPGRFRQSKESSENLPKALAGQAPPSIEESAAPPRQSAPRKSARP